MSMMDEPRLQDPERNERLERALDERRKAMEEERARRKFEEGLDFADMSKEEAREALARADFHALQRMEHEAIQRDLRERARMALRQDTEGRHTLREAQASRPDPDLRTPEAPRGTALERQLARIEEVAAAYVGLRLRLDRLLIRLDGERPPEEQEVAADDNSVQSSEGLLGRLVNHCSDLEAEQWHLAQIIEALEDEL